MATFHWGTAVLRWLHGYKKQGKDVPIVAYLRHDLSLHRWSWEKLDKKISQSSFDHYSVPFGEGDDAFSLHFIHAKNKKAGAVPLLLLHGWLGGCFLFHQAINFGGALSK